MLGGATGPEVQSVSDTLSIVEADIGSLKESNEVILELMSVLNKMAIAEGLERER